MRERAWRSAAQWLRQHGGARRRCSCQACCVLQRGGGCSEGPATSLRPYQQQVCALLHAFVAFFGFQNHICTLIAQSFGRLARAENKSAEGAPSVRGGAVARAAYFCQSMNKVEPHWGVKMKQSVRRRCAVLATRVATRQAPQGRLKRYVFRRVCSVLKPI